MRNSSSIIIIMRILEELLLHLYRQLLFILNPTEINVTLHSRIVM